MITETEQETARTTTETTETLAPRSLRNDLYKTYKCQRLKFILDFFSALNLNPNSWSLLTENPVSASTALRLQLNNDDMKVSRAKKIVETTGFELDIRIVDKEAPTSLQEDNYVLTLPAGLRERFEKNRKDTKEFYRNIGFLYEFMQRHNLSRYKMAKDLDISAGAINAWFRADDVLISYLFMIKETYGAEIIFSVREKTDNV